MDTKETVGRWGRCALASLLAIALAGCGDAAGGFDLLDGGFDAADDGDFADPTRAEEDGGTVPPGSVDGDADDDEPGDWNSGEGGHGASLEGSCLDGEESSEPGLVDCEELPCLAGLSCCREVTRDWVAGDFSLCETLGGCDWDVFAPPGEVSHGGSGDDWVLWSGDGLGESGIATTASMTLAGETTVRFAAAVAGADESCLEGPCPQALGVAFTAQQSISSSSGVFPLVGVVLDAELEAIHLVVDGRIVTSRATSRDALAAPAGYGLSISPDGTVELFAGTVGGSSEAPDEVELTESLGRATTASTVTAWPVRLVVFGRVTGEAKARVGALRLERRVCDVPGDFARLGRAFSSARGIVSGDVLYRRESDDFLLVYEDGRGRLASATSPDGLSWAEVDASLFTELPSTGYGLVSRRSPGLLQWSASADAEEPEYHLWFAGESEARTTAIVHAVSRDGLLWTEPEEGSLAIVPDDAPPWRAVPSDPAVVALRDGSLVMTFVGTEQGSGRSSLGMATSTDGSSWVVSEAPVVVAGLDESELARDGIAEPALALRGTRLHLWLVGVSGARSSIGYAVSDGPGLGGFTLVDDVFPPSSQWEAGRVLAPSIVTTSPWDGAYGVANLRLYYSAGRPGREALGVAEREIPGLLR